jgi:succinylarginine dihydrolase
VKQNPAVIDAGVFHNDVICVGHQAVLLVHELAWDPQWQWDNIYCNLFPEMVGAEVRCIMLSLAELTVEDAVRSYLFNSQLVTLPDGSMALIYPAECDEVPTAKAAIERILRQDNPVELAVRVDVRQSMKNGGGPACLRLRVVLSDEERAAVRGNVFWTPQLHETLIAWASRHYRDTLTPQDLADVRLYEESMAALDELGEILQLPI